MRCLTCVGLVGGCFWLAGLLAGAEPRKSTGPAAPAAAPAPIAGDVQDIVFLGPRQPTFIRLHLQLDGRGYREIQAEFARRLFQSLDKDQNGALDSEEPQKLSTVVPFAGRPAAEVVKAIDIDPADGKISEAELVAGVASAGTFSILARPQRQSQLVDLFSKLDLDQDGRLTPAELRAGGETLLKLDADDDETFGINELLPFQNPFFPGQQQAAPQLIEDIPFLTLTPGSYSTRADELLKRYDQAAATGKDSRLSPAELGLEPSAIAGFDANADGGLDAAELARFLETPVVSLELVVRLAKTKPGRPKLTVIPAAGGGKEIPFESDRDNHVALALSGANFDMRANNGLIAASDGRQFYKVKFRTSDQDKNQYLDEQEFPAVGVENATFQVVDRDQDGKIFEPELIAYVEAVAASTPTQFFMAIASDGVSLFEVLDTNRDLRLSRRELLQAVERLQSYDRDRDGAWTLAEFDGRYRVAFELSRPSILQERAMVRNDGTVPRVSGSLSGPEWFQKMDRNRDGDLSRREFLGSAAVFDRLDTDHDGLIDRAEAEQLSSAATRQ